MGGNKNVLEYVYVENRERGKQEKLFQIPENHKVTSVREPCEGAEKEYSERKKQAREISGTEAMRENERGQLVLQKGNE